MEFSWVFQCASADDAGLALHQTRHRMLGADTAGVRERDSVPGIVIGSELPFAGPANDIFITCEELGETKGLSSLDSWNHEASGAIGFRDIDRDAEVDVSGVDRNRLAIDFVVGDVLTGKLLESLDHGPRNEVGERDLAPAGSAQVVVNHDAVIDHQLRRNGPDAGGGGDLEALVHVGGQCLGHALEGSNSVTGFGILRGINNRNR